MPITYLLRFLNGDVFLHQGPYEQIPFVVADRLHVPPSRVQYFTIPCEHNDDDESIDPIESTDPVLVAVLIQPSPHLTLRHSPCSHEALKLMHLPFWKTCVHPVLLDWILSQPNGIQRCVNLAENPHPLVVEWLLSCVKWTDSTLGLIRTTCRNPDPRVMEIILTWMDRDCRLDVWNVMTLPDPRASRIALEYIQRKQLDAFDEWRMLMRLFSYSTDEETLAFILKHAQESDNFYPHELPANPHPLVVEWRLTALEKSLTTLDNSEALPLLFLNACLETCHPDLEAKVTDFFLLHPERLQHLIHSMQQMQWVKQVKDERLLHLLLPLRSTQTKREVLTYPLQQNPHPFIVDFYLAHPDEIVWDAWCQNPDDRARMRLLQWLNATQTKHPSDWTPSQISEMFAMLQVTAHVEMVEWMMLHQPKIFEIGIYEHTRWIIAARHPSLSVAIMTQEEEK